eukprot:4754497-Pleurochrysis_carterae.AAC.6
MQNDFARHTKVVLAAAAGRASHDSLHTKLCTSRAWSLAGCNSLAYNQPLSSGSRRPWPQNPTP